VATAAPQTKTDPTTEQPVPWNVVLLDDDDHTYEYVIRMMQELFAHSVERAFQIAKTVDTDGRVVCLTTHKEHAELKRDQVLAYGPDKLMARSKGSMTCVIEPAEFGGDEDDHGARN
jgi:ATP-dependent Clp protease adaptor protein ClpS